MKESVIMVIDTIHFKKALGSFTTGICHVATFDHESQKPVGLTVNSLASVSLEPPLLSFCLDKKSRTFPYFNKNNFFCVNILNHQQQDISLRFSNGTPNPWSLTKYSLLGNSFVHIDKALCSIDCQIKERIEIGDHVLMIGEVLKSAFSEDPSVKPLIYFRGHYIF